jgi:hypothetical protein
MVLMLPSELGAWGLMDAASKTADGAGEAEALEPGVGDGGVVWAANAADAKVRQVAAIGSKWQERLLRAWAWVIAGTLLKGDGHVRHR